MSAESSGVEPHSSHDEPASYQVASCNRQDLLSMPTAGNIISKIPKTKHPFRGVLLIRRDECDRNLIQVYNNTK